MAIIITSANIDQYRNTARPHVRRVIWAVDRPFDAQILRNFPGLQALECSLTLESLAGLEGCPQLLELMVKNTQLTSLLGIENCPDLRVLVCGRNPVASLVGLESCPRLRELYCNSTHIQSLAGLENCKELQRLNCGHNKLTSLAGLGPVPKLRTINCSFNQLDSLKEIALCTELRSLTCYRNRLTVLFELENWPQLRHLNCSRNRIMSLALIRYCPLLRKLRCEGNRLVSIVGIQSCPLLLELSCCFNPLRNLKGVENCRHLQRLYCGVCNLTELPEIQALSKLTHLAISRNILTTLEWIKDCLKLKMLVCGKNRLTTLRGVEDCLMLKYIDCCDNQITRLEPVIHLPLLDVFLYKNNPLDVPSEQVLPFLRRRWGYHTLLAGFADHQITVYTDRQNVHDTHIQKSVCDSVLNLMRDPKPVFSINAIIDSGLGEHAVRLICEYCEDTSVHSVHKLTYIELMAYVWQRISQSTHRSELIKILGEQVTDAECKCFTGRFNRTLYALVGFYDDINITISDNDRISAIILAIRAKLESQEGDTPCLPYDPLSHREQASAALLEAGYDAVTIQPWLDAIHEE